MRPSSTSLQLFLAIVLMLSVCVSQAATTIVRIGNYWFSPTNITINAGDTVVWSNTVATAHDTTSGSGLWASPVFSAPGTFSFTFTNAGVYPYFCALHISGHSEQTGTVSVVSPGNIPPTAAISSPADGASFAAPASLTINASADDTDGSVAKVEFFEGANKLGEDASRPYRFNWDSVPAGSYALTARATDNGGAVSTSSVVNIVVTNGPGPEVVISSPTNGTVLTAPATFSVQASISGGAGNVSQVEFFNGAISLGVDTSNPFRVTVNDLPAGIYTLSAVATDTQGRKATNRITLVVNELPAITITSPADGAGLIAPATFSLQATASDSDGTVTRIQFFRGTTLLGTATTNPAGLPVKGLGAGSYAFRATAMDNRGGQRSDSISLLVKARPTVTIAAPAAGARLTNVTTPLSGKAADSAGVTTVHYSLNAAPFAAASGTTNWSMPLVLPAGTNIVRVRAVDTFGNFSLTNTRQFFQVVTSALRLTILGTGTVSGATNLQMLEVGRGYRLTATPGAGFLFSNWTGHASGTLPALGFLMQSNMDVRANFVPNPFLRVSGPFNGLFHEAGEVRHAASGDFKLTVTAGGKYTASLRVGGKRHSASGKLDLEGRATNVITRLGTNSLTVRWAVNLRGLDEVRGSVSNEFWLAELLGDRATFSAVTNRAPLFGRYTLVLPATGAPDEPGGNGWGALRVTAGGVGILAGSLADGTIFSRSVSLSKTGDWPLYAPLYTLRGSVLGWVRFDTNAPLDDLSGRVDWSRPAIPGTRFYPAGFTNQPLLTGSRYLAPLSVTNRVLELTNGLVIFSGGNLSQDWTNNIILTSNRVPVTNRLSLALSLGSGLFKGAFTDTNIPRTISFSGALLQKSTNGAGYFLGTNSSGRVSLGPRP